MLSLMLPSLAFATDLCSGDIFREHSDVSIQSDHSTFHNSFTPRSFLRMKTYTNTIDRKFCFPPPLRITLENSWEKKRLYKRQRENYTSVTHLHLRHCYLCGAFSNYIGPVTLRICQESRIETLKIYSLLFANNPLISPVYFSRKRDVFSIKGDYCKSDTARTIRALRYTSPLTELRHIQCISMPRSDFETQWMAEELFRTCIWVEELLLRDGEWHLYPSNQVSNQDHIRQLGERWFFYKQLPSLTKVHLKTLRILSGSGRTKYGETDLTAIEVPPAAVLKRRYRDIIEWSDRLGLRPLPRSVPVWTEYE